MKIGYIVEDVDQPVDKSKASQPKKKQPKAEKPKVEEVKEAPKKGKKGKK